MRSSNPVRHPSSRPGNFLRWCMGAWLVAWLLAGCGGGGSNDDAPAARLEPYQVSAVIGAAGGTLTGPDGAQVVVPAGALRTDTTIGLARNADGAPAVEAPWAPAAIYEFTPHGTVFDLPVTIRMPVPAGASAPTVQMAGTDMDWAEQETVVEGGLASVQRASFSWGMVVTACASPANAPPDPDSCFSPRGGSFPVATPASALVHTSTSSIYTNPVGTWRLDAAANLSITTNYSLWPSCTVAQVRLQRVRPDTSPVVVETLSDSGVTLQRDYLGQNSRAMGGSTTFPPIALGHLDQGRHVFAVKVSCQRANGKVSTNGDTIVVNVEVPVPTVFHTIGGSASGVAGSGLVLRNNGGDDLAVAADGSFSFATPIGAGTPYAVTVANAPAGQSCTVANGSGTATTNVSNVAVACSTAPLAKTWRPATQLPTSASGSVNGPQVAVNASGMATALWGQDTGLWARHYSSGGGWGATQRVDNASGNTPQEARVAIDASGNAMAVWAQNDEDTNLVRRAIWASYYSGGTWSTPRQIETGSGHAEHPDLSMDSIGNVMAVWAEQDGNSARIRAARFLVGDGWAGGVQTIDGGIGRAIAPRITSAGNGTAVAVWTQHDGTRYRIVANRFNGTGWSTADIIDGNNAAEHDLPQLAGDAAGNAILAWVQRGAGTPQLVARRYTPATGWTEASIIVNTSTATPLDHRVTLNAQGHAVVLWQEGANDMNSVWARHYTAGSGWAGSVVRVDTGLPTTDAMSNLCLASDPAGNAIALWTHKASGGWRDLYGNRFVPGTSGWGVPALLESDDCSGLGVNQCGLGMDANGNAIAVWNQADASDIYRLWVSDFR